MKFLFLILFSFSLWSFGATCKTALSAAAENQTNNSDKTYNSLNEAISSQKDARIKREMETLRYDYAHLLNMMKTMGVVRSSYADFFAGLDKAKAQGWVSEGLAKEMEEKVDLNAQRCGYYSGTAAGKSTVTDYFWAKNNRRN